MVRKLHPSGESDLRSYIRRYIYHSITEEDFNDTDTENLVKRWIEHSGQDDRLMLDIIIPISLPPGKDEGHCCRTIENVIERLAMIGNGETLTATHGGWREFGLHFTDPSFSLNKSIKLSDFKEIPDALKDVIRMIQLDLKQRSVYYVLDNQAYGEPVNLLRVDPSFYPHKDAFGAVDPMCDKFQTRPSSDVQPDPMDLNIMLKENTMVDENSGSITQIKIMGDVRNFNFPPGQNITREDISKITEFGRGLDTTAVENSTFSQSQAVDPLDSIENYNKGGASQIKTVENLDYLERRNIKLDPDDQLKHVSQLVLEGEYSIAEGYYNKMKIEFEYQDNKIALGKTYYGIGYLHMTRADFHKAEEFLRSAIELLSIHGEFEDTMSCYHQLANTLYYNYKDDEALHLYKTVRHEAFDKGHAQLAYVAHYMVGNYDMINGDFESGYTKLVACKKVFDTVFGVNPRLPSMIMKSLAWYQYLKGNKLDSIQEFEEIIGRTPSSRMRSCIHAALGRIYLELNKVDKALYHHKECIKIRKRSGSRLGSWYENNGFTDPNSNWNYPPSPFELSNGRYDLMWPV